MDLSIKDRKNLWSAAAGICSYHFNGESCERKLFTKNGEMDTNLGEECHIIGEKPSAARYQEKFQDKGARKYKTAKIIGRANSQDGQQNTAAESARMAVTSPA